MSESIVDKRNRVKEIIETAQKRFGTFGLEKTTMREIATDLNMSKAALYYYFPDKEGLFKEVIKKEQEEFIGSMLKKLESEIEPEILLKDYALTRISYFRRLMNLSRLRLESYNNIKPLILEIVKAFRQRECEIVINILTRGLATGKFAEMDISETSSLFLDLLKGLRSASLGEKLSLSIEDTEYEILFRKTSAFADIFIKGLTHTQKTNT